jgi:carboxylate-amine ligase
VEISSDVSPDVPTARHVMRDVRAQLATLVEGEGLALVNAGTNPMAIWLNEPRSPCERYSQLEQALQDVACSILIFALHIHIGIESHELAVAEGGEALCRNAGVIASSLFCPLQPHLLEAAESQ